jgi:hypothetical protein
VSHVSECIQLYRHDGLVTNAEYGRMIEDAAARDQLEADAAEAPEPEPELHEATAADVSLSIMENARRSRVHFTDEPESPPPFDATFYRDAIPRPQPTNSDEACKRCGKPDVFHAPGHPDCKPAPDAEAATVARFVFEQWEDLVTTIEGLSQAIVLMDRVDDKRARDLDALTDAVEFLGNRMNLRADECRALSNRIDNLSGIVLAQRDGKR